MELEMEAGPLAEYLEGNGSLHQRSRDIDPNSSLPPQIPPPRAQSFAPRGLPSLIPTTKQSSSSATEESKHDTISKLREITALAVSSTLGSADNHRFLEHFRYMIIASQLLSTTSTHTLSSPPPPSNTDFTSTSSTLPLNSGGILLSALAASPILYIIRWIRTQGLHAVPLTAIVLLCGALAIVGALLYAYARRQWLKSLRKQALQAASAFVAAMQDFEASAASILNFVQEVELVSRGYRLSSPLPPVSRLEGHGQHRTCARMRRTLQAVYSTVSPSLITATVDVEPNAHPQDFDRFLEVYDVRKDDIEDAKIGFIDVQQEELESLRSLKLYQYRLSTLRRLLLCTLLSIPATGRQADAVRWRVAVAVMEYLTQLLKDSNEILKKLMQDEQQLPTGARSSRPSSINSRPHSTPAAISTPPASTRSMTSLNTGVHALSARMHLLRSSMPAQSPSQNDRPPSLGSMTAFSWQEQYDALGDDLKSLLKEWEQGRDLANKDNMKIERRISGLSRSSSNGLGVVLEDDDGEGVVDPTTARARALRALTGEGVKRSSFPLPLHLPLSPPVSVIDGGSDTASPMEEREAVFEAVAMPRVRQRNSIGGLTREQRIAKMQEEQQKAMARRRSREVQGDMMNELRTVIGQRRPLSFKAQRESTSRISSV